MIISLFKWLRHTFANTPRFELHITVLNWTVPLCGPLSWWWLMRARINLDKISSRIFVTLRYRDEDPIVEKPGAVIIANYPSVTIISNHRKTYTYWKTLTLSIRIQKKVTLLKICANVYLIEFTNSQQHWPRSNPRPIASRNQSQTQLTRPVLDLQRAH